MAAPAIEDQWTIVSHSISSASDSSDDDRATQTGHTARRSKVGPAPNKATAEAARALESPASSDSEGFVFEGDEVTVSIERDGWLHALRSIYGDDAPPSFGSTRNIDGEGSFEFHDFDKSNGDGDAEQIIGSIDNAAYGDVSNQYDANISDGDGDGGDVVSALQYDCTDKSSGDIDGYAGDVSFYDSDAVLTRDVDKLQELEELGGDVSSATFPGEGSLEGDVDQARYISDDADTGIDGTVCDNGFDQVHILSVNATAVVKENAPHGNRDHGEDNVIPIEKYSGDNIRDVIKEAASESIQQESKQEKETAEVEPPSVMVRGVQDKEELAAEILPHAHHEVPDTCGKYKEEAPADVDPHEKTDVVGVPHDAVHETEPHDAVDVAVNVPHKQVGNELLLKEVCLKPCEILMFGPQEITLDDLTTQLEEAEKNQNNLLSDTLYCEAGLGAEHIRAVNEEMASCRKLESCRKEALGFKARREYEEERLFLDIDVQIEKKREHIECFEHEKESNNIANQRPKYCRRDIGGSRRGGELMIFNDGCSPHTSSLTSRQMRKAEGSTSKTQIQVKTVRNQSTALDAQAANTGAQNQGTTNGDHRKRCAVNHSNVTTNGDHRSTSANNSNESITDGISFLSFSRIMETLGRVLASCCNCLDGLSGRAESRAWRYVLEHNQTPSNV
ncbi:hypothetical protein GOP47_0012061 [Adiantum capillus-veneris]|uniref:Uncharacterized protein n=1 Tax=Adiantum capillus-veneris TaxID=13818 RepID=A0A9D4ZFY3_ADICA|nr:hypothetical protein GOP47_0012061 [Adiantum capillus-veneris]